MSFKTLISKYKYYIIATLISYILGVYSREIKLFCNQNTHQTTNMASGIYGVILALIGVFIVRESQKNKLKQPSILANKLCSLIDDGTIPIDALDMVKKAIDFKTYDKNDIDTKLEDKIEHKIQEPREPNIMNVIKQHQEKIKALEECRTVQEDINKTFQEYITRQQITIKPNERNKQWGEQLAKQDATPATINIDAQPTYAETLDNIDDLFE
ncbi:hypothetical protein [Candidatus Phytoplasma ziziphi]|nr:hypothetical protein [Candidatus Phytoplasma ziziphi]